MLGVSGSQPYGQGLARTPTVSPVWRRWGNEVKFQTHNDHILLKNGKNFMRIE